MAAARADRARDAELAAPLGREHHEDQEDRAGCRRRSRTMPNVVKNAMNALPASSAFSIASCFAGVGLEPERAEHGASRGTTASGSRAGRPSPRFETSTCLIWPGWPSSRCAVAERQQHRRRPSVPAPSKRTTSRDAHGGGRAPGEARAARSPARASQLVGRLRGSGRPRRAAGRRSATSPPEPRSIGAKPSIRAGSAAKSVTRGSFCRLRRVPGPRPARRSRARRRRRARAARARRRPARRPPASK